MKRVISYLYLQRSNRPARGETQQYLHGLKYPDLKEQLHDASYLDVTKERR